MSADGGQDAAKHAGEADPTPSDPSHPAYLGRYRILGELGRGGMGIVLLGEDPALQRHVAIKTLPRELAENPESYARFQREARLLAALNHPNVATIHSLEEIDGAPVLTMERIRGETLASRLATGSLSIDETLRFGVKIARAIEAAHERGVIHRDLKPGNVMLRDDGEVKVLDFGLATELSRGAEGGANPKAVPAISVDRVRDDGFPTTTGRSLHSDDDVTVFLAAPLFASPSEDADSLTRPSSDSANSSRSGTIGYMSPEQILGLVIDERTDLFALGCILFECATGTPAFAGETHTARMQATLTDTPSFDALTSAVPTPLRELIEGCLKKEPGDRPCSALLVRKTLEEALERQLFANRAGTVGSDGSTGTDGSPNNLPLSLTTFVGRSAERAEVAAMLRWNALVTLTGAGGAGKTRLALEVARDALREGNDGGVWLIELSALTDPALLEKTILTAIDIPEPKDRSAEDAILDHFANSRALLFLDNCEHMLEATARFVEILRERCREVRILVTSREPLGLPGECRFLVPPLSGQEFSENRSSEELRQSDAVTLFTERARQVRPDFELTAASLDAVVGICRRLDGLPLALELAASRVRVLEPGALLARLDDRFRILTGGSREKLPHQRTLLASIEWSHEQLGTTDRLLFRRLGVFVSGFTLAHVESVCVDAGLEAWDILDGLTSLIDKSLIEPAYQRDETADTAPRYRMLETFREYANRELAAAGESEALRTRFACHWKDVAQDAAAHLNGPDGKGILLRLDLELGNIREAIRIALEPDADSNLALTLTGSLMGYWMRRDYWSEGRGFLNRALERPSAHTRTSARAVALNALGTLEYLSGRYEPSITRLAEAIDIFTELGRKREAARGRTNLGNAYSFLGRYGDALAEHDAALATGREIEDDWLIAAALVNICNVSEAMGDFDRVDVAAREASERLERTGDRANLLMALNYLGAVAYRRANFLEALGIWGRSLQIAVEHNDRYTIGHQRLHRGLCFASLERDAEALENYQAALETAIEFDDPNLLATTLEAYAQRDSAHGEFAEALRLLSLSDRIRSERSLPLREVNISGVEQLRAGLLEALGQDEYARVREEGLAMGVDTLLERTTGTGIG